MAIHREETTMRRVISTLLVLGLVFGALASAHAAKKAKPQAVSFFFHGTETLGEVDLANNFAAAYNRMDATEPADATPKSLQFTTWTGEPTAWNDCAGSYLLPVWTGSLAGKITGDMKVTLNTISGPKAVNVQVWPDLTTQTCASNDLGEGQYPEPAAQATVDLAPGAGETEVVLKHVNFTARAVLTLQILPVGPAPGRVLYDSPDFASRIEFKCTPLSGKSCTP
jgi:hypothetical protein